MKQNILLLTFDVFRPDYPTTTYSAGSIIAALQQNNISVSHYPINIQQFVGSSPKIVTTGIQKIITHSLSYFLKFDFIAIGVTRWSLKHTNTILSLLHEYTGKVILGGYEITAIAENDLLVEFPKADYFIKGYAEKALIKLVKGEYDQQIKIIHEALDENYLYSPYVSGVLNTLSRKIHWETKRGCSFSCGFCEWGNANTGMIVLNEETLHKDIEIFSKSNIDEINILDATFNIKNDYKAILKHLLTKTDAIITFQARFEVLNDEFIEFCSLHKKRLHLEFGLQTIHENEMKVIGRTNKLDIIKQRLNDLNKNQIDYEVSIIYAIPGQTVESFIDTIEFLRVNKCPKIMAFPLQVPRNSKLEQRKEEYQITFEEDEYNVLTVSSSYSFNVQNRKDMDNIAASLSSDNNFTLQIGVSNKIKTDNFQYQYKILPAYISANINLFINHIHNNFVSRVIDDINFNYSFYEATALIGGLANYHESDYYEFATGKKSIEFRNTYANEKPIEYNGQIFEFNRKKNLNPTNFYCKIILGESGNVYVYRNLKITDNAYDKK